MKFSIVLNRKMAIKFLRRLESMVGSVIQATGTVEFEDVFWIGNYLKAQNGLQRVRIIPGAVHTSGFLQGQTEF